MIILFESGGMAWLGKNRKGWGRARKICLWKLMIFNMQGRGCI